MKKIIAMLAVTLGFISAEAQYKIDSTFNADGTNEFTQFAGNTVNGDRLAYTVTNDVIVAGRWNNQLTVWKYNQNGTLDNGFGQNGLSYIPLPIDNYCWVKNVEVQNDGKIVVLAEAEWIGANYNYSQSFIVLARFLSNGTRDSSFSSDGFEIVTLVPSYEYHPMCLSVDNATNTYFVGGWVIDWGSYQCPSGLGHWFIAKFKTNGDLDSSFNSTGFIQQTSFDIAQPTAVIPIYPMARVLAIKALAGGKVLAAGAFNPLDSTYFSLRLNADGSYDNSYSMSGRSVTHINSFHIMPSCFAEILDDESIIYNSIYPTTVLGYPIDTSDMMVYKKDNAGNTQTSFGSGGFLTLHQLSSQVKMTTDNQNRIIYCWYNALPAGTQSVYFRRLSATGVTDNTFGTNGILTSNPYLNDVYLSPCSMNDIKFNAANDDISLIAFRSATYVPNVSFRILNYSLDTSNIHNGISSVDETNAITIYPNPAKTQLLINGAPLIIAIEIKDVLGKTCFSEKLNVKNENPASDHFMIDISKLPSSIYFICIRKNDGSVLVKQFVKE